MKNKLVKKHECAYLLEKESISYKEKIDKILQDVGIFNYGTAIAHIEYVEEDDFWVAHCDEYVTIIKYCPFCGEKLKQWK